ncbi:tyrosine-type recombinase/integrase [Shimia aestuarii]|uniref:tyrosine-type recombinase/integrase n=1 Tax=Shimia aestuarii TaxID=254406 RepID=UPI001FB4BC54|nr:site-specific integrase [Shimia aestuarii]
MASIIRHNKGWRALIERKGIRRSKVFASKQEAKDWAAREEYKILNGDKYAAALTFGELMDRYAREASPGKRGHRWEVIRLEKLQRDPIARIRLGDLAPKDFAAWRDRRLQEVSSGTVRREMVLIAAVLTQARKEWGLMQVNPMADVRKPASPPPRDRLPTDDELERMSHVAGKDLTNATARAFHAFLFACETAMRAGEIVGLEWGRVDLARRVARLEKTKSGIAREVPLSSEAVRLLRDLPDADPIFDLTSQQLDALFRKVKGKAGVDGLTFHDSRHAAITRLSRKLDVLALARAVGHRNIAMLQVYYNESAEDLARRLD